VNEFIVNNEQTKQSKTTQDNNTHLTGHQIWSNLH